MPALASRWMSDSVSPQSVTDCVVPKSRIGDGRRDSRVVSMLIGSRSNVTERAAGLGINPGIDLRTVRGSVRRCRSFLWPDRNGESWSRAARLHAVRRRSASPFRFTDSRRSGIHNKTAITYEYGVANQHGVQIAALPSNSNIPPRTLD